MTGWKNASSAEVRKWGLGLKEKKKGKKNYTPLRAFSEVTLVPSWRADPTLSSPSSRVFTGDGDVNMFFFYFENVFMRRKENNEKATELLAHLDGPAFECFCEKFTIDGAITFAGNYFGEVKRAFSDKFA